MGANDVFPGDVVKLVNGRPVSTLAEWRDAFEQLEPSCGARGSSFEEKSTGANTTNSSNATARSPGSSNATGRSPGSAGDNVWTMRTRNGGFMAVDFDAEMDELQDTTAEE